MGRDNKIVINVTSLIGMTKHIFWLASYPKSGNTLLRYILIALFFTENGRFSFDKSKFISQFDQTVIILSLIHI